MIEELQFYDYVPTDHRLIKKIMNRNGYLNYQMFCMDNNFLPDRFYIRYFTYDILCKVFDNFYKLNNFLPNRIDLNTRKYHLPHWRIIQEVCKDNLNNFCDKYDLNIKIIYTESYEYYCQKFIETYKHYNSTRKCFSKNGVPYFSWFVNNCPQKINTINDFITYLGLTPNNNKTKEQVIKSILNTKEILDRNLMYKDFTNITNSENISISTINHYWGSFNNMLRDLNLPINQEDMVSKSNDISIEILCEDVKKQCEIITNKNKNNIISRDDLKPLLIYNISTYDKYLKKELNISLSKYIQSIGYQTIEAGMGLHYIFDNGEKILSKHEFDFSLFLRNILQLKYNVDYKKDIKYKTFIKDYKKQSSIDYIINYNNRIIYIEIAGMLERYKQEYLDDESLKSKSKEKYKFSLKEKERILKDNNLEYYILFPQDLSEDFLLSIFNNSSSTTQSYC
jgi:hypothetical protein